MNNPTYPNNTPKQIRKLTFKVMQEQTMRDNSTTPNGYTIISWSDFLKECEVDYCE